MNGTKVGVCKEAHQIGFCRFLQRQDGRGLKAQVQFELLRNFPNEALEGQLANQKLGALLVLADFAQGNCARPVQYEGRCQSDQYGMWTDL